MADQQPAGERPADSTTAAAADVQDAAEVQRRLAELATRKRGRVRWRMSKHTAELAIRALAEPPARRGGHGKQRRRKRHKRLL
jgi:hypothetical protein